MERLSYCMRLFCGGLWDVLWWLALFVKIGKGKSGCVISVEEALSWLGSIGGKVVELGFVKSCSWWRRRIVVRIESLLMTTQLCCLLVFRKNKAMFVFGVFFCTLVPLYKCFFLLFCKKQYQHWFDYKNK